MQQVREEGEERGRVGRERRRGEGERVNEFLTFLFSIFLSENVPINVPNNNSTQLKNGIFFGSPTIFVD